MTEERPLTGLKVFAMFGGAFAVILGANLTMAWLAVDTFSGTVVDNSYISSQTFDEDRRAQEALGWTLDVTHETDALTLRFTDASGGTVRPETLNVVVGRPTSSRTDRTMVFARTPDGYVAAAPLEPGTWMVLVNAKSDDGTHYHRREPLLVPDRP